MVEGHQLLELVAGDVPELEEELAERDVRLLRVQELKDAVDGGLAHHLLLDGEAREKSPARVLAVP